MTEPTRTIELSEDACLRIEKWSPTFRGSKEIKDAVIAARPAPVVKVAGVTFERNTHGTWLYQSTLVTTGEVPARMLDRIYELENG